MNKHICIHGHFYQPPRENPWTGEVDHEPSASPFHNWNERIAKECYEANAHARILDGNGHIIEKVNNYEKMSFDFGPTLLSWMKRKAPEIYRSILEADRRSVVEHDGHGNGMAQVYNHIIMPLAKRHDKITQVIWGIRDFEFHFKRKPEGMWLSETAVDRETLEILADQGIRFTVLAPHQASRVRRVGFWRHWETVRHEGINTKEPYRVTLDKGRHFHIFFYDAGISRGIAFEGLLSNGDRMNQRLLGAFSNRNRPELVSTATDGESFGHHHIFGEMAIAYGLRKIEREHLAKITNYAQYLSRFGAYWEAEIHDRSSWSCAHGVERWRADCGCRIDVLGGGNQKWRTVLREAFDLLKQLVDEIYVKETSSFIKDPWHARNDYIHVILENTEAEKKKFVEKNSQHNLSEAETQKMWRLLEAQRFSLLMYTSCGWFFDDISGIEPTQVMKFALKAMELIRPYYQGDVESDFLKVLERAESNIAGMGNGAQIFEKFVRPAREAGVKNGI